MTCHVVQFKFHEPSEPSKSDEAAKPLSLPHSARLRPRLVHHGPSLINTEAHRRFGDFCPPPPSVCLHPDPPFLGAHGIIPAAHRRRIIWACGKFDSPSPLCHSLFVAHRCDDLASVRLMMETRNDVGASEPPPQQTTTPRPRITNACEACRSAKVKCQASSQLGICRRYVA